jgi:transketolase C-terminal domain/subunit
LFKERVRSACFRSISGGPLPAIRRLGIPDAFVEHYGSQDDLMELYGLQPPQIAATVRRRGAADPV